jgi:23S rRNA pseudouridine1911/1915/1917 synthase
MTLMATDELPRLDVWLTRERNISRHAAQTLIDAGLVTVNGRLGKAGQRIRAHDAVAVHEPMRQAGDAVGGRPSRAAGGAPRAEAVRGHRGEPEARLGREPGAAGPASLIGEPPTASPVSAAGDSMPSLNIVYEDEWLAVVDKPAGLVVHPAAGHAGDTLVDALIARGTTWSLLGGAERAGIVHRLDRDTSGLLVVAKTEAAHRALAAQLKDRTLGRTYIAVVHGGFQEDSGTVDAPIGRDRRNRKRMAVVDDGRPAITDFRVAERLRDMSVLEVSLRTGRTHQIRVHMAYIRHPIAGDSVYGRRDEPPGRPALHARRLTFTHPAGGGERSFESPLPDDIATYIELLRGARR